MSWINKKIIQNVGLAWGTAFLSFLCLFIFFGLIVRILDIGNYIDTDYVGYFFAGILWIMHAYMCYVLAKYKNRNAIAWALLGVWFVWFAVIVLSRLNSIPTSDITEVSETDRGS